MQISKNIDFMGIFKQFKDYILKQIDESVQVKIIYNLVDAELYIFLPVNEHFYTKNNNKSLEEFTDFINDKLVDYD